MKTFDIAVDFDGTCVTHEYPNIGKDIGAVSVLKKLTQKGHRLILFTMRSGDSLIDAVSWFRENEIPLYGINRNPTQEEWTESPKAYAQLYIDDAAIGCPLAVKLEYAARPFVNWVEIEDILTRARLL